MKSLYFIPFLIFYSCNDVTAEKSKQNFKFENNISSYKTPKFLAVYDSLSYDIKLNKSSFFQNEPIEITVSVRNMTSKTRRVWIEVKNNKYPTGTYLSLKDVKGNSLVEAHRAHLSSQIHSLEEVEEMKTFFYPNASKQFQYNLREIVQLKEELNKGNYFLSYANSDTLQFQVK